MLPFTVLQEVAPLHSVQFVACRFTVISRSPVSFLTWSLHLFSGLPLFRGPLKSCLYACLSMLYLCIWQTCPNHLSLCLSLCLMTPVIDSGVKVSFLILIFYNQSALVTPLIARRQHISKTSRDWVTWIVAPKPPYHILLLTV